MSLTNYEQRQLQKIEAALINETPGLNRLLRATPMGEARRARIRHNWLAAGLVLSAIGLALVVLGVGAGRGGVVGGGLFLVALSFALGRWGPRLRNRRYGRTATATRTGPVSGRN